MSHVPHFDSPHFNKFLIEGSNENYDRVSFLRFFWSSLVWRNSVVVRGSASVIPCIISFVEYSCDFKKSPSSGRLWFLSSSFDTILMIILARK